MTGSVPATPTPAPVLPALVGSLLAGLSLVILATYCNSFSTGYATTIYTDSFGEFWPEVALLVAVSGLGLALAVSSIRQYTRATVWRWSRA